METKGLFTPTLMNTPDYSNPTGGTTQPFGALASQKRMTLWPNWIGRETTNLEIGGSSPSRVALSSVGLVGYDASLTHWRSPVRSLARDPTSTKAQKEKPPPLGTRWPKSLDERFRPARTPESPVTNPIKPNHRLSARFPAVRRELER